MTGDLTERCGWKGGRLSHSDSSIKPAAATQRRRGLELAAVRQAPDRAQGGVTRYGRGGALCHRDDAGAGDDVVEHHGLLQEWALNMALLQVVLVGVEALGGQAGLLLLPETLEEAPHRVVRRQVEGGLVLPPQTLLFLALHVADLTEHNLHTNTHRTDVSSHTALIVLRNYIQILLTMNVQGPITI